MLVRWKDELSVVYIKEKMSNGQTFYMAIEMFDHNADTNYWNIGVAVYNKRKHSDHNEDNKLITGKVPFEAAQLALKAFPLLEREILMLYSGYNNTIMCDGTDARRTRVYYKYLSKHGYTLGRFQNKECIIKTYEK